jgi:alkylated DNA repair dioxygenase AlkB
MGCAAGLAKPCVRPHLWPMDLFPHADMPHPLLDDAEGGIRYWPHVVDAATAQAWFAALRAQADWQHQQRPMYDRVVAVPRLLASYRLDAPAPAALPLAAMLACVQARVPAPYNALGMNLYRDGRDSVAMHHDTLHMLQPGMPIALLSLGAPRRMQIRPRAGGAGLALVLAPGSLLAMSHASQLSHLHGIAKTAHAVGERISAVFRVRPAARLAADRHGPHGQGPLGDAGAPPDG